MKPTINEPLKDKFRFGDKVRYRNREAIYLQDISVQYDFKSDMVEIVLKPNIYKNVRLESIRRGWK